MTKPIVYYWAPSEGDGFDDGIALLQDVDVGDQVSLVVNTPVVPPAFSYVPNVVFPDVLATITPVPTPGVFSYVNMLIPNTTMSGLSTDLIRSINISSAEDNSGVTFIISGIGTPIDLSGNPTQVIGPITEILIGPGAGEEVTSDNIYTVINSITNIINPTTQLGANANDVFVGYGPNGIINYNRRDNNRNVPSVYGDTYQLQFINNTTMLANTYVSLNTPETPNVYGGLDPFGLVNGASVAFIPYLPVDENINFYILNSPPFGYCIFWVQISNCTTDSMFLTVMQPGI